LDGSRWSQIHTAVAPPARISHALAYDLVRGRTLLFGGISTTSVLLADTWEFDGANWAQVATTGSPAPRSAPALAHDLLLGRTVLFGGYGNPGLRLADTWVFDGTSWTAVISAVSPSPRTGHALAYDLGRGRTVLFGGAGSNSTAGRLADTWEFDGFHWSQVATAGGPSARSNHVLTYDMPRARTVLFGGVDRNNTELADTWE